MKVVFDKNTVEFVTVAVEYCSLLERMPRSTFVETTLKILPLLYLKASMLPECEMVGDSYPETFVTEADYELIRMGVADVLGAKDDYLEVFLPEMAYSDTPLKRCISEDLADIYQDVKDFLGVYRIGFEPTMHDALAICRESFASYWGQKLVNVLRALHNAKYTTDEEEEFFPGQSEDEGTGLL